MSIGRVIEYEVCGQNILHSKPTQEYGYSVDRSPKEIKIRKVNYETWFVNPSQNCTIVDYQMVKARNIQDERDGKIDPYNPDHFTSIDSQYSNIFKFD